MITFTILAVTLLILAIVVATIAIACGLEFIVVFGDLFVFAGIIWLLVKLFRRRK